MALLKAVAADGLPELKGVLRAWTDWVESYCSDGERPDAPYWHNEQVNTSTLVNVIARMGGWALTEMPEKPGSRRKTDLWFMLRDSQEEFCVEAKKLTWWWYPCVEDYPREVKKSLNEACRQVARYKADYPCTKLGMVFVDPQVREGNDPIEYSRSMVAEFDGWPGCDARAWFFNDNVEHFTVPEGKTKNVYPGVMLFVRKA